ncbi:MAG: ABC transporter permease subunit [Anaerolineae bacterium]
MSASLVAIPPALAAAIWLHGRARSSAAWFAAALPLAFPSPLIGIGLITAFNTPVMPLHGTSVMPVLAAVARFAPLIALLLFAQRSRLDPALLDAGRVFQAGPWHGFRRVVVPLMLPGLVAAAAVGFVPALGELGATLIVAPPGRSTLTMRIYTYLHFGASDSVAVLCLVLLVAALAAGATAAAAVGAMWGDRGGGGAGDIGDVGEAGA